MDEPQSWTRRRFLGETLAIGAGLLASLAWVMASNGPAAVEAGASPTPRPRGQGPGTVERKPVGTKPTARPQPARPRPPSELPEGRGTMGVVARPRPPSPAPREKDHVRPPGAPPAGPRPRK